jgi:hypothetical protein
MAKLNRGVAIRDFDLEGLGFSLAVLDEQHERVSEGDLRMTLGELSSFLDALKAAGGDVELSTVDPTGVNKLPRRATVYTG